MTYEDINKIIDNIAQKLGITSEYLITEYGKYQVGLGVTRLIVGIIFIIITCIAIIVTKKSYDEDLCMFAFIIGFIAAIIGIIFIISGFTFIPWIISPTAAIVHEILSKIR